MSTFTQRMWGQLFLAQIPFLLVSFCCRSIPGSLGQDKHPDPFPFPLAALTSTETCPFFQNSFPVEYRGVCSPLPFFMIPSLLAWGSFLETREAYVPLYLTSLLSVLFAPKQLSRSETEIQHVWGSSQHAVGEFHWSVSLIPWWWALD